MLKVLAIAIPLVIIVWMNAAYYLKRHKERRHREAVQFTFDNPPQPGPPGSRVRVTYRDEEGNLRHKSKTL